MTTLLEVFNGALDRIGETPKASTEGTDLHSRRLRRRTPELLREAGELYPWNWCMTREALSYAVDGGTGDLLTSLSHDYIYELPGWRLRLSGYSHSGTDGGIVRRGWREESGFLHANFDTLYIIATDMRIIEDIGRMPQVFRRWLTLALAAEICPATEDRFKLDDIKGERDAKWSQAMVWDAQQGPDEPRQMGAWNRARTQGKLGGRLEGGSTTEIR